MYDPKCNANKTCHITNTINTSSSEATAKPKKKGVGDSLRWRYLIMRLK